MLSNAEAESVAAICLLAALADGSTGADERQRLERVFTLLDDGTHSSVYQRVVMGGTSLEQETANLASDASRQMAYDMAVGVCEADGSTSDAERTFLGELEAALGVDHKHAMEAVKQGDKMARVLIDDEELAASERDSAGGPPPIKLENAAGAAAAGAVGAGAIATRGGGEIAGAGPHADDVTAREIDSMVLKYSILNGAIELLPQDLATVAILPLQTKMVYRIGKRYGYSLSAAHIKEFLGVLGVGMTSQILEGYARKLFGKVAKKALGKTAGKLAGAATGPAMTFATTYALGQVAKQYYAGGRKLSAVDLKAIFQRSVNEGQQVYQQHSPQVQREAGSLSIPKVMNLVRGKGAV